MTAMTNRGAIGEALGRIVSGVSVLTADDGQRRNGVLVSWVQQASFEPPMLVLAVRKGRPIEQLIGKAKAFTVCILAEDNNDLLGRFSKGFDLDEDAFEGLELRPRPAGATGAPVLAAALAYLDCELAETRETGDHNLYMGRLTGGGLLDPDRRPMVHVRRTGFHY